MQILAGNDESREWWLSGMNASCPAQGITAYQTDYSMAALTVRAEGSPLQPADGSAFNLPMASLDGKPGARAHPPCSLRCST